MSIGISVVKELRSTNLSQLPGAREIREVAGNVLAVILLKASCTLAVFNCVSFDAKLGYRVQLV